MCNMACDTPLQEDNTQRENQSGEETEGRSDPWRQQLHGSKLQVMLILGSTTRLVQWS